MPTHNPAALRRSYELANDILAGRVHPNQCQEEIEKNRRLLKNRLAAAKELVTELEDKLRSLESEEEEINHTVQGYFTKLNLLRKAGCTCMTPLIGERPGVGPRCRLCGVVAEETSV